MTKRLLALSAAAILAASLGGCSSLRNTFGVERGGPDEFTVVRHAPLTLPPDYNLRPPQPGVPRPQEGTTQSQARSAVVGSQSGLVVGSGLGSVSTQSSGEAALLQQAGQSDPSIRDTLNQEAGFDTVDRGFLEGLIFWRKPEPAGDVVDPEAEAARLKTNAEQGLPVTAGETPIIKRRKKALLEGIF
ncbi:MAG TPA: DUF3035 domain-containing protein [Alphaproteobacteria bacterium]|jgi:hypothetical protein|nr:DUF3035 domain-containing protein [Alphaproteobacteria bacterium]